MLQRTFMLSAAFAAILVFPSTAQQPAFEVAAVRPNRAGGSSMGIRFPGVGQFNVINMPLREIIRIAYQVQSIQIEGGPDWMTTERFDIVAKAESPPKMSEVSAMLRTLLADRFVLRMHSETREMPIYALVLAREDGRLGDRLQPATTECRPLSVPARMTMTKPPPPPPSPSGQRVVPEDDVDEYAGIRCGALFGPGFLTLRQFPMSRFARDLTVLARRMVVDRTGLTGRYDIDLEFTPEFLPQPPPGAPDLPAPPSDGPSLFTAFQEQLGLKLESTRGPVEILVIDHAERPTPD